MRSRERLCSTQVYRTRNTVRCSNGQWRRRETGFRVQTLKVLYYPTMKSRRKFRKIQIICPLYPKVIMQELCLTISTIWSQNTRKSISVTQSARRPWTGWQRHLRSKLVLGPKASKELDEMPQLVKWWIQPKINGPKKSMWELECQWTYPPLDLDWLMVPIKS